MIAGAGKQFADAGGFKVAMQRRRQPEGQKEGGDDAAELRHGGKRGGETAACQGTGTGGEVKSAACETRDGREKGGREDGRKEAQAAQKNQVAAAGLVGGEAVGELYDLAVAEGDGA